MFVIMAQPNDGKEESLVLECDDEAFCTKYLDKLAKEAYTNKTGTTYRMTEVSGLNLKHLEKPTGGKFILIDPKTGREWEE